MAREHHRGRRPAVWSPGETSSSTGAPSSACTCSVRVGLEQVALRALCRQRALGDDAVDARRMLRAPGRRGKGGAGRSDGLSQSRRGRQSRRADRRLLRFASQYGFRPDSARQTTRNRRDSWKTSSDTRRRTSWSPRCRSPTCPRPMPPAAWCEEVNAKEHSEICAVPSVRLAVEAGLFSPLPSLRPRIGEAVIRKVDKLSCIRFGSARYSVPMRLIGKQVEVVVTPASSPWCTSGSRWPSMISSPRARRPSTTTTTAGRGRCLSVPRGRAPRPSTPWSASARWAWRF